MNPIFGKIMEIERNDWPCVWVQNASGEYRISINKDNADNPKLQELKEGDYCAFDVSLSAKRNDRGYPQVTFWFRDLENFTRQAANNSKIESKIKDDEPDDDDLPF